MCQRHQSLITEILGIVERKNYLILVFPLGLVYLCHLKMAKIDGVSAKKQVNLFILRSTCDIFAS